MKEINYMVKKDLKAIQELQSLSQAQLAEALDVSRGTIDRWEEDDTTIDETNIEKIYTYAFKNNIFMNRIKAQLYQEEYRDQTHHVLFHGAKHRIIGEIDIAHSKNRNDFGQGFYCGESLEQSALYSSGFEDSSIYVVCFDQQNLSSVQFKVDQKWMLVIAYFRGKLKNYENSKVIQLEIEKIKGADYIIAPIADNRMFQIIDRFIEGEITDDQCKHCLAATNLGYQYVFKTQKALHNIKILEKCYLCKEEKETYQGKRIKEMNMSDTKIKMARRQYRGQGQYIDEIL